MQYDLVCVTTAQHRPSIIFPAGVLCVRRGLVKRSDFSLEAGLKAAGDHRRGPGVKSTQVSGYLSQLYLFL